MSQLTSASPPRARAGARGNTKFIIGGVIVVLVVLWLIWSNIGSSTTPYLTVQELIAEGESNRLVRGTGFIVGESIDWDPRAMVLRFEITDESGSLQVVYEGPRPDLLEDATQAVVEGRYTEKGVFEATTVLLKCPSKYTEG
ncbi:MAG: cytochrome c maturation protein CcmE [Anaerolineales bacterium]|nr:MAG: cytochrome c maturation protein CcmE [Anaerolineales bacterium]